MKNCSKLRDVIYGRFLMRDWSKGFCDESLLKREVSLPVSTKDSRVQMRQLRKLTLKFFNFESRFNNDCVF